MRKVLITAIVILSVLLAGLLGFIWYTTSHVFVDGEAYAKYEQVLDLREEEITESHYLAVKAQLPDSEIIWNVPFQNSAVSSDSTALTISELTQEDIRILTAYFPELKKIDASACTDYSILGQLALVLPSCEVSYQVELGGASSAPGVEKLVLEPGSFDFDILMSNLVYLTQLQSVHFPKAELTLEQQAALAEAYPDLSVTSTVEILGEEYDDKTEKLDLSAMKAADVEAVSAKLALLPQLKEVELMSSTGTSQLTLKDVQALKLAAPEVSFHYAFDFYGIALSTEDEEVILKNITVQNDGFADELRMVLDVLENCDRFVLEARGPYDKLWQKITDEELAEIREEYRDRTKVVWRVYFGENGSSLTDAEVLRAVYGLTDDNSKDLIYCENVRFLDLGHNEFLDYMDFLSGMKDLEVAILSGAPLKDLNPIAACKNLKFLELANCIYLPDINALKECTQLEMLNISFTKISDISVLDGLKLTHLNSIHNNVSEADIEAFIAKNPDCWTVTKGNHYGEGWRTDADGKYLPWYAKMVTAFHYPNAYNNIGWYLPDEE